MRVELIGDQPWSGEFPGYGAIAATKGWAKDVPDLVAKGLLNTGRFRECVEDARPIPQNTLTLKRKAK